jgi:hypothetical protein
MPHCWNARSLFLQVMATIPITFVAVHEPPWVVVTGAGTPSSPFNVSGAWSATLPAPVRHAAAASPPPSPPRAGVIGDLTHFLIASINAGGDLNGTVVPTFVTAPAAGSIDVTTGQWDGAMGLIQQGVANATVAFSIITQEAQRVAAFTPPFLSTGLSLLVPSTRQAPDLWRWTRPLDNSAWGVVAAVLAAYAIGLWYFDSVTPFGPRVQGANTAAKRESSFPVSLWRALIVFNGKPVDNPSPWSSRLVRPVCRGREGARGRLLVPPPHHPLVCARAGGR